MFFTDASSNWQHAADLLAISRSSLIINGVTKYPTKYYFGLDIDYHNDVIHFESFDNFLIKDKHQFKLGKEYKVTKKYWLLINSGHIYKKYGNVLIKVKRSNLKLIK